MKFQRWWFLLGLSIKTSCIFAADDDDFRPQLKYEFNHIQSSKFRHHSKRDRLSFQNSSVMSLLTLPCGEKAGLQYGLGFDNTRYNFHGHPHVIQKSFYNLLASFGGLLQSSEKLAWNANVLAHINTDHFSPIRYTLYEGLIQGIYSVKDTVQLIFGGYLAGGLQYTSILPILGINYAPSKKFNFSAAFPINVQADYKLTDDLGLNCTLKQFFSRQKLGINEPERHRRGIISYTNTGLEFGINYNFMKKLKTNIHIGEAFGSHVSVSKRNGHRVQNYQQKSSRYFGFVATFIF